MSRKRARFRSQSSSMSKSFKAIFVLAFFAFFMLLVVQPIVYLATQEVIQITVEDKERVISGHGQNASSKYLIFGEEEVVENVDSLIFGKFNSSDVYRDFKTGKTYEIRVAGLRIPFLSMYRNVVEIKGEVAQSPQTAPGN